MGRVRTRSSDAVGRLRGHRMVVGLLALVLVASACSSSDDTTTSAGAGGEGPRGVQELVVGAGADPWVDASEGDQKRKPNYPLNADVCETLVQLTADFSVAPMVTRASYVGNNTFRFTLVDGVKFSDGTPVTAADLKYSVDYTTKPPAVGSGFIGPDSTKIVDDRTIDVTPTRPNLRLIEEINHPSLAILKPPSDPLKDVVNSTCTGPFKVQSYTPSQQLVVVKNTNYWGEGPRLDKITFKFYPDEATRALALQNNEVDLIIDVPLSILDSIARQPGVKIARAPVGNNTLFYIARRTADGTPRVTNDPLVRRAIAASMNSKEYVDGVLGGNAEVVPHIAPPSVLGEFANKVKGVPFNPTEAGRLLDQAGWTRQGTGVRTKDGKPLTIKIVYDRVELTTAEYVQAKLRAVGIDAQVAQLDAGAYRDTINKGDYDLDISVPNQNNGNPAFLLALRWYSKATGANAKIISPGPGTKFESIIDQTLLTDDPRELRRLAADAMQELVDVEVGGVTLAGGYRVYAMKNKVMGFEPHPSNTNLRWRTVFIRE